MTSYSDNTLSITRINKYRCSRVGEREICRDDNYNVKSLFQVGILGRHVKTMSERRSFLELLSKTGVR